jgi:DHA1 family tetracycline resistance protein-like MFS transporter
MTVQPSPPAAHGRREAAMLFIAITVLLDMVAIGLIFPVLPHLVGTLSGPGREQTFWFGVLAFSFGLATFVGAPVLGALSDRFGRRPVLLVGVSGLALSFFVTAAASALWVLVVVRLFSGAMQANAAVANAYVADITPADQRARRFGVLGAMFGIGFTLGQVIGGLLGAVDIRLPFVVAGILALVNWGYGFFVLPESLPRERRRPFEWRRAQPFAAWAGLARLAGVGPLVVVIALSSLAQFTLHTSWVLYTHFKFGWGPAEVGWSLFAVGAMAVFVQGFLLKHLLARFTPRRLVASGLIGGSAMYLGFGLASSAWMVYAVIVLGNLLAGGTQAALSSLVSNAAGPQQQGATMGAVASLSSLMAVVAPVASATLLGMVADRPQGDPLLGLPLFFSAALQATAALIAFQLFRRRPALVAAPT